MAVSSRQPSPSASIAPEMEKGPSSAFSEKPKPEKIRVQLWNDVRRLLTIWQQGLVASIGAVMGIAAIFYFFSAPMKEDTVHQTAVMASEALRDENLRTRAAELSKTVVTSVLNDPNTTILVQKIVVQLLEKEEVTVAVSSLLSSLFEDRYTQETTKKFVLNILRDPWVKEQVNGLTKQQVLRLLNDQEIKEAFSKFLSTGATEALVKDEIHTLSANAIRSILLQVVNPLNLVHWT